jgi:hypothetical protein
MKMLTNGHAWAGYQDSNSEVPAYPLRVGPKRDFDLSGTGVWDASGKWMATFRNDEDATRYVVDSVKRAQEIENARVRSYDNSKVDTGDNDRTLCRVCLKYKSSDGIGHHTKAVHNMKLGQMLKLRVPTEREFRQFHATKAVVQTAVAERAQ